MFLISFASAQKFPLQKTHVTFGYLWWNLDVKWVKCSCVFVFAEERSCRFSWSWNKRWSSSSENVRAGLREAEVTDEAFQELNYDPQIIHLSRRLSRPHELAETLVRLWRLLKTRRCPFRRSEFSTSGTNHSARSMNSPEENVSTSWNALKRKMKTTKWWRWRW